MKLDLLCNYCQNEFSKNSEWIQQGKVEPKNIKYFPGIFTCMNNIEHFVILE